jgi:hypothetical protein
LSDELDFHMMKSAELEAYKAIKRVGMGTQTLRTFSRDEDVLQGLETMVSENLPQEAVETLKRIKLVSFGAAPADYGCACVCPWRTFSPWSQTKYGYF